MVIVVLLVAFIAIIVFSIIYAMFIQVSLFELNDAEISEIENQILTNQLTNQLNN